MVTFNRFDCFMTDVAAGLHAGALNADTDTLKVYLTNSAPNAATMTRKADLAEIATGNGYTGPLDVTNAASISSGQITVTGVDVTWTAGSGGSFGPARYVVLFNDTALNDPLIGWWDKAASVTMTDPDTFTTDFGASLFTVG